MIRDVFDNCNIDEYDAVDTQPRVRFIMPQRRGLSQTYVVITPPTLLNIVVETLGSTRVYDTISQYVPLVVDTEHTTVSVSGPSMNVKVLYCPAMWDDQASTQKILVKRKHECARGIERTTDCGGTLRVTKSILERNRECGACRAEEKEHSTSDQCNSPGKGPLREDESPKTS